MKKLFILFLFVLSSLNVFGQDCTIISKANNLTPDKLCAPVTVSWNITYNGVNNNGAPVQIRYVWGDGTTQTVAATNIGGTMWTGTLSHVYTSRGRICNYHPQATLIVNGVLCTSSTQEQIVTVWDDDNHNGGVMRINPTVWPICFGNGANARFQDLTQFNCVPPQERDNPNVNTRWIQWIYGTAITMTGVPVTINGTPRVFPYTAPVVTLVGPVTGSGVWSDVINVANDKLVGQYFQITLRNWNYCNPYDDPNIPGPPLDLINGDHPPVVTTARVLIVGYPNATITSVPPVCANAPSVILTAATNGGTWSGPGVSGNVFNPSVAGSGSHIIRYSVTNSSGCNSVDTTIIVVKPVPNATITPIGTICEKTPPITLTTVDTGGVWSGNGVVGNIFNPSVAGVGSHTITYSVVRNGCSDTDNIVIVVNPLPNTTITPIDTLCSDVSPITLTAVDTGGVWSGNGVIGNVFDPSVADVGSHMIKYSIVNPNGCTNTDSTIIVVKPTPRAIITPIDTICGNNSIVTLTAVDSGGVWSGPGVSGNIFDPSLLSAGNYTIKYDININGCTNQDQTIVTLLTPNAMITPIDTLCENDASVELTAHDSGGIWSGNGVVGDTFNPAHTFNPRIAGPGSHTITYNLNNLVCNDIDSITVTVMSVPTVFIQPVGTVFINDPPIVIKASPRPGILSGIGISNDSIFTPSITGPGEWIINYETVPDRWGCMSFDTIHIIVIVPPPPISSFTPDTVGCSPLTVQFVNTSLYGEVYTWDFGDGTYSKEKNPVHTYFIPGNYIVKLTVNNIIGQSVHNSTITVYKKPTAIFEPYPATVVTSEKIVVFHNYSYNATSYLWDFGDGTTSNEESPYHKYEKEGEYTVSLWASSPNGCVDSTRLTTPIVVEWKEGYIRFANVFKWNETGPTGGQWRDGYSPEMDYVFRPFFENVIEYKLQIFNRWGVLIYESTDLSRGWDGYWGKPNPNKLAMQGVYVWKVTGRFANGEYFDKVGDVTFLH